MIVVSSLGGLSVRLSDLGVKIKFNGLGHTFHAEAVEEAGEFAENRNVRFL